jgi:CHAD domain-containing protein
VTRIRIHKCIAGITPDDCTGEAAVRTLKARLGAVQHYLPLAAKKADKDIEYVHSLRMWTRRAQAALKLYGEFLPPRRTTWVEKQLKRIRQAAGDARDYDVLAESLGHDPSYHVLKKRIHGLRVEAQEPLVKIRKRLERSHHFDRRIKKLLQEVRGNDATIPPFGQWAHDKLRPIVKSFFQTAPTQEADLAALHRFRIRGKELRYAMELLAGAFPPDFPSKLYAEVEIIQDRLGKIIDLATAQVHLRHILEGTGNAAEKKYLLKLLTQEQARLEQAHKEFLDWCTPQFLDTLHAGFNDILSPKLTRPASAHKIRAHAK